MRIQAQSREDAWNKAKVLFGCGFKYDSSGEDFVIFATENCAGCDNGYVYEYDNNRLELILPGDQDATIEIVFKERSRDKKDQIIDDLESKIDVLRDENKELCSQIATLKGRLTTAEREREQNKTLRKMLATYSNVAEEVEKYLDSAVEFREFLGKVKNLKNHLGAEGE